MNLKVTTTSKASKSVMHSLSPIATHAPFIPQRPTLSPIIGSWAVQAASTPTAHPAPVNINHFAPSRNSSKVTSTPNIGLGLMFHSAEVEAALNLRAHGLFRCLSGTSTQVATALRAQDVHDLPRKDVPTLPSQTPPIVRRNRVQKRKASRTANASPYSLSASQRKRVSFSSATQVVTIDSDISVELVEQLESCGEVGDDDLAMASSVPMTLVNSLFTDLTIDEEELVKSLSQSSSCSNSSNGWMSCRDRPNTPFPRTSGEAMQWLN